MSVSKLSTNEAIAEILKFVEEDPEDEYENSLEEIDGPHEESGEEENG